MYLYKMQAEQKSSIHFLGGAGTVTGSKTLIDSGTQKVMIDCGLFQGLKELRQLNWEDLPVEASKIDAVILTHAHLDHCGYLPALVKGGFRGKIYCTAATAELAEIILLDSAKIQEEDADRANRKKYSSHLHCKPLYTQEQARKTFELFDTHNYNEWVIIDNSVKFQLLNAGHILGSAMIEIKVNKKTLLFSGDIGRKDPMLLYPPKKVQHADYVILESTYGDRTHSILDVKEKLLEIILETNRKGGILMIPSFAVERTQEMIFLLHLLKDEDLLPNHKIYLDSPMGIKSTLVFDKYPEMQDISKHNSDRMYDVVEYIETYEESKAVVADKKPKIIIAGSGMLEGGRILHYLANHGGDPKNTILFVGFQAAGTRGRDLVRGNKQIKLFGKYHEINAEIRSISSMSAHADKNEMLDWLGNLKDESTTVFLNHGEPHQTNSFRVLIESKLGWHVETPRINEVFEF
jgi:metallo-beta-lactamase family protein